VKKYSRGRPGVTTEEKVEDAKIHKIWVPAISSSWVFQVREMGFGDPGRPKNVTYNIPVKSTFHMYAADYSSFFEHGERLG